ncbi:acetyl-CoA carboxylase carboxyltransferase subunit alpha [Desulfuribacillus stibiiarsenatis]|uniref:Acetyl-coenzyme A carboxylase carboxyl transferase subunit alpha n=1 Tax=Desulfuribacillus stibiiarsenatis TaxID=1390249 RepID=A0A1E5L305_9FIRM|nr:acetyl-CoA carboxylase carboxyltransferase subunit alpha [Desulfuribacillus stibiiarsenatis]
MKNDMNFEKPLTELREKIDELKKFTISSDIDLSDEIAKLEERAVKLENEIYGNLSPWQKTQIARHSLRPTSLDYIKAIFEDFIELHGDRSFADDPAIVGGIAILNGQPVTVLGHQKGKDTKDNIARNFGMPHPEGYRKALRLMKQAEKFKRPIICLIDTPGAYPGKAAEERGQGEAIAKNLFEMAGLTVPIISIVTGEGGSGGALALGVADRIYMLENAIYSVISPEGAAALLWKDASLAQKAAETMKITAKDLYGFNIIDGIIEEPKGGAHKDTGKTADAMKSIIVSALEELYHLSKDEMLKQRYNKYKNIGCYQ